MVINILTISIACFLLFVHYQGRCQWIIRKNPPGSGATTRTEYLEFSNNQVNCPGFIHILISSFVRCCAAVIFRFFSVLPNLVDFYYIRILAHDQEIEKKYDGL